MIAVVPAEAYWTFVLFALGGFTNSINKTEFKFSSPLVRFLSRKKPGSIEAALAQSNGKIAGASGAAAKLGIPASTLESKIRTLRINKFQFKGV